MTRWAAAYKSARITPVPLLLTGVRHYPPGRTDKNLCRCFGAPVRRVFPDHLITPLRSPITTPEPLPLLPLCPTAPCHAVSWYAPSTRTRVPSFGQTFPNKVGPCHKSVTRNEWFTFATRSRSVACGAVAALQAAGLTEQSAHAVGGTACADCSTAIWSCDPRRRALPPFGALHMAPPPHAV